MIRFFRNILQIIGGVTLFIVLSGFCVLFFAGYWMDVNERPVQADYILPLAGDTHRMIKAAELYQQGYAPVILLSKAAHPPASRLTKLHWEMGYPHYQQDQYYKLLFGLLGVSLPQFEPFGNGHVSTVEEAEALQKHLNGRKVRLLIVTSPYHARRAKMIFEKVLPECIITMTVTEEGTFKTRWWNDQISAQNLIMEFAKTAHYLVGGVFRSTDPTSAQ